MKRLEALAVLAAVGGNVERAAKMCGVPGSTLDDWAKSKGPGGRLSVSARLVEIERELTALKCWRATLEEQFRSLRAAADGE
jgi:hypothetical protein